MSVLWTETQHVKHYNTKPMSQNKTYTNSMQKAK